MVIRLEYNNLGVYCQGDRSSVCQYTDSSTGTSLSQRRLRISLRKFAEVVALNESLASVQF